MNTNYPSSVTVQQSKSMNEFKMGVNDLLERRSYFISQVLPKLKENFDFYVIKGKKSLSKGGAEKLCSIYNLSATFEKDAETMSSFSIPGLIAYTCTLSRNGVIQGQGRGCSTLAKCEGDPNKAIKMAEKSSYISATIRTTGLSDIFTQDLETMPVTTIIETPEQEEEARRPLTVKDVRNVITEKQKVFLASLITEKVAAKEKQKWLSVLPQLSRISASEMINSFLMEAR